MRTSYVSHAWTSDFDVNQLVRAILLCAVNCPFVSVVADLIFRVEVLDGCGAIRLIRSNNQFSSTRFQRVPLS